MASLRDGCPPVIGRIFQTCFENNTASTDFLRNHGVLPSSVQCPTCKKDYRKDKHLWRCIGSYVIPKTKKRRLCNYTILDYHGTNKEQESFCPNQYTVIHFLRNVCSPILAELLVKDLKNSKFIKDALVVDREATLNKTLFEILKNVNSKGKRQAARKKKTGNERSDGSSKTQHLNNLEDNENILNQVRVIDLVLEGEVHEESRAVKTLGKLDSALLLNILTNNVLEFPLSGIERDLDNLKESRNSIFHNDDCSKKDVRLWEAVGSVYKHLGKDVASFQEKKRSYFLPPLSRCHTIMKELQQEIHRNYSQSLPYYDYSMQPAIKHLRRDCQSDEIVENLVNFLKERRACWSQEPRPILLCGAQGAGKSSILHSLVHSFISTEDFLLVVLLDESKSNNKTKESFWKHVYDHLMDHSPLTVGMHGRDKVIKVLENYSGRFLFLWDVNLQDARNPLSHMDRGTWVLSHQGLPENSTTNCCLLKVAPLSEKQVREILCSISSSEEHCSQVLACYSNCEYKGVINSPDMVHIFDSVCLGMTDCIPFYKLIQMYIDKKIDRTEENNADLIKLGERAFHTIRSNRKYYNEKCLVGIQKNVRRPFLEHSLSKGYFFKYRVVEDYLAAWYIVHEPKVACDMWLKQATLFKRVFEVVCALWCEGGRESLCNNLQYVRKYLEKLFDISDPKHDKEKRQKNKKVNKNKATKAIQKNQQTMELDDNCDVSRTDKNHEQAMEVDEQPIEVVKGKEDEGSAKEQKNKEAMVVEDGNDDNKQDIFARWVFLSKIAKERQNNQDILHLLADLLTCKNTWLFKCKLLKEEVIDNISLVLRYIKLTKKLTIKLESGPNVATLIKLWKMLSGHSGLSCDTTVHLVIRHTESNWVTHEKLLARLPSMIVNTNNPLYITKYVGPLFCSSTPHFLKCLCMTRLEVLDLYVCDLASLQEVLAHQQHSLLSVIVRLNLKLQEQRMIPKITQIQLSSSLPLTLTITYFENLQALLDKFEPPGFLNSLKIYRVYIHENFKLNLTHFTEMESLFIRFVDAGRLPPVHLEAPQSDDQMEVSDENDVKSPLLPIEHWTLHLVLNLYLPTCLERFLMRNLSFCDDSNMSILHRYWDGLPFQRLTLLDTHLSVSTFKSFLNPSLEDITEGMGKKFRLDGPAASSSRCVVKQGRLKKEEREERRKHKPEGKELIMTSEAQLCKQCHLLSCTCVNSGINHSRDTYEDLVSLVKKVYLYDILNISYSGKGIVVRKDMCGDLQVQCPLPFLDDNTAQHPESHPELCQVIEALALSQIICLSNTNLSHKGAVHLLDHLKDKKKNFGTIEPFRLTIWSCHYRSCSMSEEEVKHSPFMRKIKSDSSLQQFNFKCECRLRCHHFKKAINGQIYFNNIELIDK